MTTELDIQFLKEQSLGIKRAMAAYRAKPWESFYENLDAYRNTLQLKCASAFGNIVHNAWQKTCTTNGLMCPVAVYYVNSHLLRSRVACPAMPVSDGQFSKFFEIYAREVGKPQPMKTVFPKRYPGEPFIAPDHILGFFTEGAITHPDLPLVVTVCNGKKRHRLNFQRQILLSTLDINTSNIDTAVVRAVKRKLRNIIRRDCALPTTDPMWLPRLIGPPLQFVSGDSARPPSGEIPPSPPFYSCTFPWLRPDTWRAVHYMYFAEDATLPTSSGCTVMLVEKTTCSKTKDAVNSIEHAFVALVRSGMCLAISNTVSRVEESIMSDALQTHSNGVHMVYPKSFATSPPPGDIHRSKMPLLLCIQSLQSDPAFKAIPLEHVTECLTYLVESDNSLTTGYSSIITPIFHSVKKLWFLLKTNPPQPNLAAAVERWNGQFRDVMRVPQKDLDEVPEKLLQVLALALGIEHDLGDIPSYREHFVHSFHVYLTGLCLLKTLTHHRPHLRNPREMARVVRLWYFTAFWHDISYAVEMLEHLSNRYVAAIQRKRPFDHKPFEQVPFHPSFGHLLVEDTYFHSMLGHRRRYLGGAMLSRIFARNDIQKVRKICRKQLISRAQHGVLSSLVFLHDCSELKRTHGLNDDDIGRIASSIMLHHFEPQWMDVEDDQKDAAFAAITQKWFDKPWGSDTILPSLLMASDFIAQWGRNFEYARSAKCLLESFTIDGGTLNVTLRYPDVDKAKIEEKRAKWFNTPLAQKTTGKDLIKVEIKAGPDETPVWIMKPPVTIKSGTA